MGRRGSDRVRECSPQWRRRSIEDTRQYGSGSCYIEVQCLQFRRSIQYSTEGAVAIKGEVFAGCFGVVVMAVLAEEPGGQSFRTEHHGPAVIQVSSHVARWRQALQQQCQ